MNRQKNLLKIISFFLSLCIVLPCAVSAGDAAAAAGESSRICEGQWVFDKIVSYAGNMSDTPVFDTDLNQAMLFYRTDGVTFVAMCGFPGEVIAGGETGIFPMGMAVQDLSFQEGYRFDDCWLGVTAFDVGNPHELHLGPDGNYVKFINVDNPEDDRTICHASVWKDPVDEKNYGSSLETKTASWRFPYGIRDGETITVWFVDSGKDSTGPALGWRYVWQSTSSLRPLNGDTVSRDVAYSGNTGAWVMSNCEVVYPDVSAGDNSFIKDSAVYQDEENGKMILAYLSSTDMLNNWGFFESIFDCPPEIIPEKTMFTVNITTNSLGGYGNAVSNGASLEFGKNMDSWKSGGIRVEMWDEEETRYYSSVNTSGSMLDVFDSVTKPFSVDLFRSGGNNAGDKLTIIYRTDSGPAVVFSYVWNE